MNIIIISLTAIVFLYIGRVTKRNKYKYKYKPQEFSGDIIFEDITIRKKGSEVWAMYENKPTLLIINYVKCFNGVNGIDIDYNLRLPTWPDNCKGIDDIREYQMYNSKELLINNL